MNNIAVNTRAIPACCFCSSTPSMGICISDVFSPVSVRIRSLNSMMFPKSPPVMNVRVSSGFIVSSIVPAKFMAVVCIVGLILRI